MGENKYKRDWRTLPSEYQWRFCTEGYLAHPDGTIKSVDKWVKGRHGEKVLRRGKVLKQFENNKGYLLVSLRKNGKSKSFSVHRLVAQAFIPNPDNKPCVNHKDENPLNCNVENLEWVTQKENINYGTHNERVAKANTNGKRSKPVVGIDPNTGKVVVEFPSTMEAGRNGYDYSSVAHCCRGERKTYKGLIWHYKDEYKPIMV